MTSLMSRKVTKSHEKSFSIRRPRHEEKIGAKTMLFSCNPPHNQFVKRITGYVWLTLVMFGYVWLLRLVQKRCNFRATNQAKAAAMCLLQNWVAFGSGLGRLWVAFGRPPALLFDPLSRPLGRLWVGFGRAHPFERHVAFGNLAPHQNPPASVPPLHKVITRLYKPIQGATRSYKPPKKIG
jgi:hypothetical protein